MRFGALSPAAMDSDEAVGGRLHSFAHRFKPQSDDRRLVAVRPPSVPKRLLRSARGATRLRSAGEGQIIHQDLSVYKLQPRLFPGCRLFDDWSGINYKYGISDSRTDPIFGLRLSACGDRRGDTKSKSETDLVTFASPQALLSVYVPSSNSMQLSLKRHLH
jgi:hypothetical protein